MLARLLLFLTCANVHQLPYTAAIGYHYERPAAAPVLNSGHNFAPLPTIVPLPPVPAIPALPTARANSHVQTQTLLQVHPPTKSIAAAYRPPSAAIATQSYTAPTGSAGFNQQPRAPALQQFSQAYQPPTQSRAPNQILFGQRLGLPPTPIGPSAPSAPASPLQAAAQPLRIPFGKQAIIHNPATAPGDDFYVANGRQLKQYAVIEIIDNDIEQNMQPFLSQPFFDSYRAHIGASGTGAVPGGVQLDSRSAFAQAQQSFGQPRQGDAIALGSGGLGFIRLANGNVYLGSGSLGYVSSQQRQESVRNARTRAETATASPLHFGHGALGGPGFSNALRFK